MRCQNRCCEKRVLLLLALVGLSATAAWAVPATGPQKVQVCHIPPGNPANFHTITISDNALPAHLAHGDLAGPCSEHCGTLCSDGDPCTVDACDPVTEQCAADHPPVNCDDSNPCTADTCNPTTGCQSTPIVCNDGDNCTVDVCNPTNGICTTTPVACPEGQTCDPATGNCVGADPCASNPCVNGDCAASGGGYVCACPPGYTGVNCEIEIDECASNPCQHGDCIDQVNSYQCACPPGFTGVNCEMDINECASNPCVNGSCIDHVNSYQCACAPGFTGVNCEIDINECASNPCPPDSVCIDQPSGYFCYE